MLAKTNFGLQAANLGSDSTIGNEQRSPEEECVGLQEELWYC